MQKFRQRCMHIEQELMFRNMEKEDEFDKKIQSRFEKRAYAKLKQYRI